MPHIVIDGKRIEAKQGSTVLQAASENGIEIPHFCWHPELSISGNCRMCLVEVGMPPRPGPDGKVETDESGKPKINYFPKLQIACATEVSEGMHIKTKSDKSLAAQEAVMEFILINHPLDCPICDEAGECKLQEYSFRHGRGESRFDEIKNRAAKRVSWGPNVMFDAERCISCSRCIRFSKEIAGQDVLTFVNRGDHVTIELFEGTELDNPYSMNVIDICPVGALTSKDFRFKTRVWEMSFNPSICPGCARGCNIYAGVRNNEIQRLEPKSNPYVNKYWMCDYGRLTQYKFVNEDRITAPFENVDAEEKALTWQDAFSRATEKLSAIKPARIMVLGSAGATNEDNYLIARFAAHVLKTKNIDLISRRDKDFGDDFLKFNDKTPNTIGAREVGVYAGPEGIKADGLLAGVKSGLIDAVIAADDFAKYNPELLDAFGELDLLILCASNRSELTRKADIVFATSTYAEVEGTFTNALKRVQHFEPALTTRENVRQMGMKTSRWDTFGAHNDRWTHHEMRDTLPIWRIFAGMANQLGAPWAFKSAKAIFDDIAKNIHAFKGMSYKKLDENYGATLGKGEEPEKKPYVYEQQKMKPQVHQNKFI